MSWDPFQRAVLAELGHVLYRPPGAAPVAVDEAMLARLSRAAGVDIDWLRTQAEIAVLSTRLRGDAAAKRALWPRLRGLRRSAQ